MKKKEAEPINGDIYRPVKFSDAKHIARSFNENYRNAENAEASSNAIMCTPINEEGPKRIWGIIFQYGLFGRTPITQVHEKDGQFISFFGGYIRGDTVKFTTSAINNWDDIPNPMDVYVEDAVKMISTALDKGMETFIVQVSDGKVIDWMEGTIGMKRDGTEDRWIGDRETMERYVDGFGRPNT